MSKNGFPEGLEEKFKTWKGRGSGAPPEIEEFLTVDRCFSEKKESVSFRSPVSHASVVAHTHAYMDSTNWIQGIIKR